MHARIEVLRSVLILSEDGFHSSESLNRPLVLHMDGSPSQMVSHSSMAYHPYFDSRVMCILTTDEEPNVLDDIFDELEEATDMNTLYRNMHLSAQENGWLALHIVRNIQEQKESLPQIIEKELEVRDSIFLTVNPDKRLCSLPCHVALFATSVS